MLLDLLGALRGLRKNPLFTAAIVLILAMGVGANTAVFSIVDAVLLRPSPYVASDRMVRVEEGTAHRALGNISAGDFQRWYQRSDVFEKIVPYLRDTVTITGDGSPEQVVAIRSLGLFPLLGVSAHLGRTLAASDDEAGSRNVALLSDRLWQRRYHGDPAVIGKEITISDESFTVVGVMPPGFEFRFPETELWTSLRLTSTSPWFHVVARLRADVTITQARSAMDAVARQMEQEKPKDRAGLRIALTPWSDMPDEKYRLTLVFVLVGVGLVMLIACADVGALLLSRAVERQKEIAIRASLGAGAWRIVRQLLAEGLALSVLASLGGMLVAKWLLGLLGRAIGCAADGSSSSPASGAECSSAGVQCDFVSSSHRAL